MRTFNKLWAATLIAFIMMICVSIPFNQVSAHATLEKQQPVENEVVQSKPEAIQLEFNEPVHTQYTKVKIYNDKGKEVGVLKPKEQEDSKKVTFDTSKVEHGTYAVHWETVSLDGHEIRGQYNFSVGEKTANTIETAKPFYTDAFFWLGLVRFVLQTVLLIFTGLYMINVLMKRQDVPTYDIIPRHRSAILLLIMVAFTTGIVYLMTLPKDAIHSILTLDFRVWMQFPFVLSMVSLIIVLILFSLRRMESIWYKVMPLFLMLSLAISGHAWAQAVPFYSIILRTLHLMGIAIWLGSFAYLIAYTSAKHKHSYILIIKDVLLKVNVTAVIIVILTGVLMSIDATSLKAIVTQPTLYSSLWFMKVVFTIIMMILGGLQTYKAMQKRRRVNRLLLYLEFALGICLILAGVIMSQIEIPL
ncbi:copper resistance CopC/CopD family protein [Staphylococcus coagulans]|uniref:copper resistance CopC/CopD family protein n=1 Tax=Staphylococcus coagulans TaxID=74706 RepID=UPI0030EBEA4E